MAILILVQMKCKLPYEVKNFWGGTGPMKQLRLLKHAHTSNKYDILKNGLLYLQILKCIQNSHDSANFLTVEVALTAVRAKLRTSLGFNFYKARI